VGLLLAAYESGAVLPWDHRAWEAWLHVRDGARLFGLTPGSADDPAATPLALVEGAHIVLGVAVAAIALAVAWRAVQVPGYLRATRRTPLRVQVRGYLRAWAPALAVVALAIPLALLAPSTLGPAPVAGLYVSRPHWPFLWLVPLQAWFGSAGLLALPLLLIAGLTLAWRPPRSLRVRRFLLLAVALVLAGLTVAGAQAS
jgi:hypothetical protein